MYFLTGSLVPKSLYFLTGSYSCEGTLPSRQFVRAHCPRGSVLEQTARTSSRGAYTHRCCVYFLLLLLLLVVVVVVLVVVVVVVVAAVVVVAVVVVVVHAVHEEACLNELPGRLPAPPKGPMSSLF